MQQDVALCPHSSRTQPFTHTHRTEDATLPEQDIKNEASTQPPAKQLQHSSMGIRGPTLHKMAASDQAPDPLVAVINADQSRFSIFISHDDNIGSRVVSNRDLRAGGIVLREQAIVWIVQNSSTSCRTCSAQLTPGQLARACRCGRAVFCSAACTRGCVPLLCDMHTSAAAAAKASGVAIDLLRMCLV
jgi:hypothetical protein